MKLRSGMVLRGPSDTHLWDFYVRVVRVRGDRAWVQQRTGSSGRFSKRPVGFDRKVLESCYQEVTS